jgi:hypothetical protein
MKSAWRIILVLALNCAGCSYLEHACRNLVAAPVDCIHDCMVDCRVRRIARQVWREVCENDQMPHSHAYAKGFEDGFVDYVEHNGTADAPAMPPAHLRNHSLHDGPQEIEDWYAGFRHGASAARESGLREKYLIPIGQPPRRPNEPVLAPERYAPPAENQTTSRRLPALEPLPKPADESAHALTGVDSRK